MIVTLEIKPSTKLADYLQDAKRAYLLAALQRASGNVAQAARSCQLNRTHFFEMMNAHGLTDYARGLRLAVLDIKHAARANHRPDLAARESCAHANRSMAGGCRDCGDPSY